MPSKISINPFTSAAKAGPARTVEAKDKSEPSRLYFVMLAGERRGPFSTEALLSFYACGTLSLNTAVWSNGPDKHRSTLGEVLFPSGNGQGGKKSH